jgi:beta-barrel assembly-enhancing protease
MKTKAYIFILLYFLGPILLHSKAIAQIEKNYTPLKYTGDLPKEFEVNYSTAYLNYLKTNVEENENKDVINLFEQAFYEKKNLLFNGNLYFNEELVTVSNKIKDKLLAQKLDLKSKINIYFTRFSSANAFALPEGSIFINIGLLTKLENEAQLAFIISHEIAHFELSHSYKRVLKITEVEKEEKNNYNPEGASFRQLKYSREDEFEADAQALRMLIASGYAAEEAANALIMLEDSTGFHIANITKSLKDIFESESIKLDSSLFQNASKQTSQEKRDLIFSQKRDDLYETHPDIEKRVAALREMTKLLKYEKKNPAYILFTETQYKEFKTNSQFECLNNLLNNGYYNQGLYLGIYLNSVYPENSYVQTQISKSLYSISYYKEINKLDETLKNEVLVKDEGLDSLNTMLSKLSHNELKKMFFEYASRQHKANEADENLYLYYALATEVFIGKEPSKFIYSEYLTKFPGGKHINFAKTKLL